LRQFSGNGFEENKNTHFTFSNFFCFEILTVYEMMWASIEEPEKPQMTKQVYYKRNRHFQRYVVSKPLA